MPRVRIQYGARKFWFLYKPEQTFGDFAREIGRTLAADAEDLVLSLEGFELLRILPCEILCKVRSFCPSERSLAETSEQDDVIDVTLASPQVPPSPRIEVEVDRAIEAAIQASEGPALKRRRLAESTERLAAVPLDSLKTYSTQLPLVQPASVRRSERLEDDPITHQTIANVLEQNIAQVAAAMDEDDEDGSFKIGDNLSDADNFTEVETDDGEGAGINFDSMTVEELAAMLAQQPPAPAQSSNVTAVASAPMHTPVSATPSAPSMPTIDPAATLPPLPLSPVFHPASPNVHVKTPPALAQESEEEDNDFVPSAMPLDSDASSSGSSDSEYAPPPLSMDSAAVVRRHMAAITKQPPTTDHLQQPKSGLEMPMLYHPDLVKPEYHWVSLLVGFSPDDFWQLRNAPLQPDDVGLQDIPCARQVIDWVNQGREDEVKEYLNAMKAGQEQNKADALAAQAHVPSIVPIASTSKLPSGSPLGLVIGTNPTSDADMHSTSSSSEASSSSDGDSSSDSSDLSSDSSESSSSQSSSDSSSKVAQSIIAVKQIAQAPTKKESAVSQKKTPVRPGAGLDATHSRNRRRRKAKAARKAERLGLQPDQIQASISQAGSHYPDDVQAAKLEAMKALDLREEQDLKMYSLQSKNKNKKKQKNFQKLNGSDAVDFGFSKPVHPLPPSARSDLPSNIIVSYVDVEAADWEPGHSFPASNRQNRTLPDASNQVNGNALHTNTATILDEWQGWMTLEQVTRQWPLLARVKDANDLQKGDPFAFQLVELDYSTSAPEFATYYGRLMEDPIHSSQPDANLIPTTPFQASAMKQTSLLKIKLHPSSVREDWEDGEGATDQADVKEIMFDRVEDPRRAVVRRSAVQRT